MMRVTRRYVELLFLLAAGLLAGCSVNEPEHQEQQEISLRTGVTSMQRRAPGIDTNAKLREKDLKIDAYFHDTETKYLDGEKLHYTGSSWVFWDGSAQVHCYWPIEGSVYEPTSANLTDMSLDFVGLCPYDKPSYIGTPTYAHSTGVSFTCDMSGYMSLANQESFQEYLVAVLDSQTVAKQTAAGGALPMSFKHSLALIKFVITNASGTHVEIDSIGISGLYTGGTCSYDGTTLSWSGLTGSAGIAIEQTLKVGSAKTETDPMFVIPAEYGTRYLTVKSSWDEWSDDVTISDYGTNVSFSWQPGYSYTYNLTLDSLGLKVDGVKFTEQW